VGWPQRRSEKGKAVWQDWAESEPLQFRRVAFGARGIGPWKSQDGGIPVITTFGQKLQGMRIVST